MAVLNLLRHEPERAYSLSEICRELGMNVATAHSLLASLVSTQFLVRHPATKRYSLGPALVPLGVAASASYSAVAECARDEMDGISQALGRQCIASTVLNGEIVVLRKSGRPGPSGLTMDLGQRLPYLPPFGTVFSAWSDAGQVADWLRPIGPDSSSALVRRCIEALGVVRRHGYSVGLLLDPVLECHIWKPADPTDPERPPEQIRQLFEQIIVNEYLAMEWSTNETYRVSNISTPVFGADGHVALALCVPYFNEVITGTEIEEHASFIRAAADRVTEIIHGHELEMEGPDREAAIAVT